MKPHAFATALFLLVSFTGLMAQQEKEPAHPFVAPGQMEFPDGPYVPTSRDDHPRSPAYNFYSTGFSIVQVNVDENGMNIVNDAANEPSITFNPLNHNEMAIGWRQFDNINNSFRQAGYAYTTNGGQSWTFPGVINPGVFRSDPVLGCDGEGNFYYNSLTSSGGSYWTNVYKSSDGGSTWEMGTFSNGGDKQWMAVDRTDGIGAGHIYEFWNGTYSVCTPDNFTRSTDGNESYESCSRIPGDPYWGTTFVGPDGSLYICGAQWDGFMVGKSTSARDPGEEVSWDFTVSVNLGGQIIGFGGDDCPNPEGLLGQTIITMDSTGGPGDGYIYLLCSLDRQSSTDPCDVMFSRSMDGGMSWSAPLKLNDDATNIAYQWFGTMSVAPDGRIDVIWLDTRNNLATVVSALYYTYSLDQGLTWSPNERLSNGFDPHIGWPQQNKMGDYFDMFSDENGAHLAWAATFNGEQDVYYSRITPSYVTTDDLGYFEFASALHNYPNPFTDRTVFRYKLAQAGKVTLTIFSATGDAIATVVNEKQDAGLHQVEFQASGLSAGMYSYRLQTEHGTAKNKFILLK